MAIKYEYNSTCCNHYYIEIRDAEDVQIFTKCNVCGQGDYTLVKQTILETLLD